MNRGNIPGYYYDEQAKKYFKIQANHLVPDGAKYSKGNVKLERRSNKKRKVEEGRVLRREAQTITRARVLRSAVIGGIGLMREHGLQQSRTESLRQVEHAFISQLQPHSVHLTLPQPPKQSRLQDAHYIPELKQMVVTGTSASCGHSMVYATRWGSEGPVSSNAFQPLVAFNSAVSTISTHSTGDECCWALICAKQHQLENVAYVPLPRLDDSEGDVPPSPGSFFTIGRTASTISDSAIHPQTGSAAIMGSSGIYVLEPNIHLMIALCTTGDPYWPHCEPCINWINPNTLLYGSKAEERGYSAMLWDTRTPEGKVARFNIRDRLTGVWNAGNGGPGNDFAIFTSTNHRIDLFDMRMPANGRLGNAAVHCFNHVHGGPRLQRAATDNLLAAVDSDNVVQVYSTRSGMKMASLISPTWKQKHMESPILRQLGWYDEPDHGLLLQAVRGNEVVRWNWGGAEEESDDES